MLESLRCLYIYLKNTSPPAKFTSAGLNLLFENQRSFPFFQLAWIPNLIQEVQTPNDAENFWMECHSQLMLRFNYHIWWSLQCFSSSLWHLHILGFLVFGGKISKKQNNLFVCVWYDQLICVIRSAEVIHSVPQFRFLGY